MNKKKICILPALLALSILLTACGEGKKESEVIYEIDESAFEAPMKTTVQKGDLEISYDYEAQLGPKITQLKFKDPGTFNRFEAGLGESVKKGQVIATADTTALEEAIKDKNKEIEDLDYEHNYKKQSMTYDRDIANINLKKAYEDIDFYSEKDPDPDKYSESCVKAGSFDQQIKRIDIQLRQEQETYELERKHLTAELKKLKEQLSGNRITAPCDGVVVAITGDEYGDQIDTSKYYIAVADTSVVYARCESPGTAIIKNALSTELLAEGKKYELSYVPRPDEYYIEMRNSSEISYEEFAVMQGINELEFGDVAYVRFVTKRAENVLLAPKSAVHVSGGKSFVYKDENGTKTKTYVTLGMNNKLFYEIKEGLEEGDTVYVEE
ncbi:MAG: efflux RND transporter periplasmic adaptor subunit [Acetatifactor sp.]|nr:efflux RND transporter periplasmic adaptor subunit [Acetatifactor sp.]